MGELPEGLLYKRDFLREDEERCILEEIRRLCFSEIRMRGVTARRRVVHYGLIYGYDSRSAMPGPAIPDFLESLRHRCAEWLDLAPESLAEALVTEYTPGAGIGWHRDAPMFGAIIGVSLLAPCRMRFRQNNDEADTLAAQVQLDPRSAYALTGESRNHWQHTIPPMKTLRYSVTFRTVARMSHWQPTPLQAAAQNSRDEPRVA